MLIVCFWWTPPLNIEDKLEIIIMKLVKGFTGVMEIIIHFVLLTMPLHVLTATLDPLCDTSCPM